MIKAINKNKETVIMYNWLMNWNQSLKWEFTYVKLIWELSNNCSSFDAFKPKLVSGASFLRKYALRNWSWPHLLFLSKILTLLIKALWRCSSLLTMVISVAASGSVNSITWSLNVLQLLSAGTFAGQFLYHVH